MQEDFSIEDMEFLHLADAEIVDFTKDRDITNILAYNKETNDLVRIKSEDMYENMLQEGARIVITKNVKDGTFTINHAYDTTILAQIKSALTNIYKAKPADCVDSCMSQCMDFCSYNCSTGCTGSCVGSCVGGCGNASSYSS